MRTQSTVHPNYEVLAGRIAISNLHKETQEDFAAVMRTLRDYINPKTGKHSPLIADDVFDIIQRNAAAIQAQIDYTRDYTYGYFSTKTLCRSYLLRIDSHIIERPQHMLMRVAIGIHQADLESAFATYHLMSKKFFTHGALV